MPITTALVPLDASSREGRGGSGGDEIADGASVRRLDDGTVVLSRLLASAPQLYVAPLADAVAYSTDLGELLALLRERGQEISPHHGTVLAYLRGDDVASAPTTFYEGVLRLRVGDELRVAPDGSVARTRPQPARPASGTPLSEALAAAVAGHTGATVLLGEDLASAALVAAAPRPEHAITVRAASTRARDADAETGEVSRARAAAQAAGVAAQTVHPTTDRFKKDLADLVRTQAEPFAGLGVYAHYCAMREAAGLAGGAHVLDATGPRGAGIIGSAAPAPAEELPAGAGLRERVRRLRGRRVLQADAVLAAPFLASTAATGHLPAATGSGRDTAAVVAAVRNAERFRVSLVMPLLDADVSAALALAVAQQAHGARRAPVGAVELAPLSALADARAGAVRPERLAAIDQGEWLARLKGTLYQVFRSAEFAGRPWVDQRAVLEAFEAHVAGRTVGGDDLFWRLLNLELWMRECVDARSEGVDEVLAAADAPAGGGDHGRSEEPEPKEPLAANPGKQLDIRVAGGSGSVTARRYPIQTGKFAEDSDMDAEVARYVGGFFAALDAQLAQEVPETADHREATVGRPWNLTISEKIIAIMQGRSYFVWDIQPSRAAQTLSRYVSRTPAGIGLGDPVTMQLAIQEAGLPRVLLASAAGAVGKAIGRRGLFYEVVGGNVRAIDGPTEYSVYPANVSAKLPPKDPDRVAEHLNDVVRRTVPAAWRDTFTGTVVMDANDIGRNTLGKAAPESGEHYELQFADNPLGQGREQTPMAIVFER